MGDKVETEFSDPDDSTAAAEYDSLLTRGDRSPPPTSPSPTSISHRPIAMTEDTTGSHHHDGAQTPLGLSAIARYPKGVFFCLGNEFSERFSYYGMRAVLTLYLITVHDMEPSVAKLMFHAFVSLAYFTPVLGSILADGFLGRYRVILYISILYCFGHLLLTVGAVTTTGSTAMKIMDFTGLFVIALSTGGIKPCVSAFAADQFPEHQHAERKQFFSFFYFSINLGALISKIITPILRRHHCLGEENCFPLAFGVPAIFMFVATGVFWAGSKFYKIVPRTENVILKVCQCVTYALRQRAKRMKAGGGGGGGGGKEQHWLDYARPKYDQELIDDIKTIMRIVVLFIPVVFFWSLFDQLGSTWVLQANAMNGRVGMLTLLPDQMPVMNPFLIIVFVPILEGFIYPLLSKCNFLVRPLRRMGWGGLLAALSFAMAGILQLSVDKSRVIPPEQGYGRLVVISYAEETRVSITGGTFNFTIDPGDSSRFTVDANQPIRIDYGSVDHRPPITNVPIAAGHGYCAVLFRGATFSPPAQLLAYDLKKTAGGKTRLYAILEDQHRESSSHENVRRSLVISQNGKTKGEISSNVSSHVDFEPELWGSNVYDIYSKTCGVAPPTGGSSNSSTVCTQTFLRTYAAEMGAADLLIVRSNESVVQVVELIPANAISMLWQIPQYLVITIGEILFSITGLEFSYSEASTSMKSVLTAIWLLTTAFGNVIDMIISGSGVMRNDPAGEFFVYASLMCVVMMVFIMLAWRYKSVHHETDSDRGQQAKRRGSSSAASRGAESSDGHLDPQSMKNHLSANRE